MSENKMVEMLVEESLLDQGYSFRQIDNLLRRIKAAAWDEGFNVSENNVADTPNPYRTVKDN